MLVSKNSGENFSSAFLFVMTYLLFLVSGLAFHQSVLTSTPKVGVKSIKILVFLRKPRIINIFDSG
jgi:hypothetical protein